MPGEGRHRHREVSEVGEAPAKSTGVVVFLLLYAYSQKVRILPPPLTFSPFRPFFLNASSPTYRIDGSAKPLADELRSCLPGLRGAPQSFGIGTPSGVNWIHANDHFVCRKAHSIPLAADFNDDGECDDAGGGEGTRPPRRR